MYVLLVYNPSYKVTNAHIDLMIKRDVPHTCKTLALQSWHLQSTKAPWDKNHPSQSRLLFLVPPPTHFYLHLHLQLEPPLLLVFLLIQYRCSVQYNTQYRILLSRGFTSSWFLFLVLLCTLVTYVLLLNLIRHLRCDKLFEFDN